MSTKKNVFNQLLLHWLHSTYENMTQKKLHMKNVRKKTTTYLFNSIFIDKHATRKRKLSKTFFLLGEFAAGPSKLLNIRFCFNFYFSDGKNWIFSEKFSIQFFIYSCEVKSYNIKILQNFDHYLNLMLRSVCEWGEESTLLFVVNYDGSSIVQLLKINTYLLPCWFRWDFWMSVDSMWFKKNTCFQ